eukprot:2744118-Prymnesium_polylepis.1
MILGTGLRMDEHARLVSTLLEADHAAETGGATFARRGVLQLLNGTLLTWNHAPAVNAMDSTPGLIEPCGNVVSRCLAVVVLVLAVLAAIVGVVVLVLPPAMPQHSALRQVIKLLRRKLGGDFRRAASEGGAPSV